MELFEKLIPVFALLTGWFLNGISQYFRGRKEDKKGVARAIADLLEVRHQLNAFYVIAPKIFTELGAPKEAIEPLRQWIVNIFSENLLNVEQLSKRYNESVDSISSTNPVLAFRLRSKDLIQPLLQLMSNMQNSSSAKTQGLDSSSKIIEFKDEIYHKVVLHLEKIILELSWAFSLKTWWKVRKLIKDNNDFVMKDIKELVEKYKEEVIKKSESN